MSQEKIYCHIDLIKKKVVRLGHKVQLILVTKHTENIQSALAVTNSVLLQLQDSFYQFDENSNTGVHACTVSCYCQNRWTLLVTMKATTLE